MKLNSYRDLIVWQKGMLLVVEIYNITSKFPKDVMYGLKSQMERASVSIVSQIAEGYLRQHRKEYAHFLSIALGSGAELETQILVCKSLFKFKDFDFTKAENILSEVMKMLYVLMKNVEKGSS